MPKMVQVPISFLEDTHSLIDALKGYSLDNDTQMLCKSLGSALAAKEAAMEKRAKFSEYKNAVARTDEREAGRKEYLDSAGIGRDWRTEKETRF